MAAPLKGVLTQTPWRKRDALNRFIINFPAAGSYLVDPCSLFRVGSVNFGVQIQMWGVGCTPQITLGDPEDAEADVDNVPWMDTEAIADGDIKVIPFAPTAILMTVSGPGSAIVSSF